MLNYFETWEQARMKDAANPPRGYRSLPSVDGMLSDPRLAQLIAEYSRDTVRDAVRSWLSGARERIGQGEDPIAQGDPAESVEDLLRAEYERTLRPVINATGVIIHTNLGRAPLSREALAAAVEAAAGYSNLEMDLNSGERGSRHVHVETLLCKLTGAEAGIAVNNNASALLLALMALAQGRDVIVSRGEAVEIGGGFRIPDVLRQSGAGLVEVGTTNRTYVSDFEQAVTGQTAAFLRVHTSNFRVTGFVHTPSLEQMVEAGTRLTIPVLYDIGSGCLIDCRQFGLAHEPTPQESVNAGVDLTFFSGDKLLGGPQSGIVVGKKSHIDILKRHPLARAVRLDKLTMASLAATLLHYAKGAAIEKVPVWRMIAASSKELDRRARRWARAAGEGARVGDGLAAVGGGSLPGETLPSRVLRISGTGEYLEGLAGRLRQGSPAVMGRIEQDKLVLDPRTVLPEQDRHLVRALQAALKGGP